MGPLAADAGGAIVKKSGGFTQQEIADPAFYAAHRKEILAWMDTMPRAQGRR